MTKIIDLPTGQVDDPLSEALFSSVPLSNPPSLGRGPLKGFLC